MGCWTTIKSFHVKIILLDKQELIQEVQVTGQQFQPSYLAQFTPGTVYQCPTRCSFIDKLSANS